jgi:V/A-type H+-transporting ATPase subunit K
MLENITDFANVVLQAEGGGGGPLLTKAGAAAIAVGLGALGTGIAQRGIGAAAVGAVAEDDDMFVPALIFTALPETLIIIAFVTIFVG